MSFSNWLRSPPQRRRGKLDNVRQRKLFLEPLEERRVLSTFQVTNTGDSGAGSLRQAIVDANALPGADTIKFKHSGEGTITLSSQLDITSDITIDGPGANKSTVSGGGTTRVFHIAGGATVKIEDLTVANGFVQGENGGGILNEGTLTLEDSVVTGNKALTGPPTFVGGNGGGIDDLGTLILKETQVTNNYAYSSGGGIAEDHGTVIVRDSKISNNSCQQGGGMYGIYGAVTLDDAVVSLNSASFGGGGVALFSFDNSATLTVTDSLISQNSSASWGPLGGGLSIAGKLTMHDSIVTGNTGGSAGGLYLNNRNGGSINNLISHSRITNNMAGGADNTNSGGGIFDNSNNDPSLVGTRIEDSVISGASSNLKRNNAEN